MLNNFIEAGEYGNTPMIHWNLIDVCQYKCKYCYNEELINKEEFKKGLHQQSWKLALKKLKNLSFDFNVAIHGGEPTLHPELHTIINELELLPHCSSIVLSTNITAEDNVYTKLDRVGSKVSIHLSYHPEYHRKIFDKIVRIVDKIKHIKIWVGVILYPKVEYYQQMIEFLENLKTTDIIFHVVTPNKTNLWKEEGDEEYYNLFNSYLEDSKQKFKYKHITNDKKVVYIPEQSLIRSSYNYHQWKCQAMSYTIGMDGTIINNCTNQRLPILIKESDVKKFVICPKKELCYCSEMFNYKKYKND